MLRRFYAVLDQLPARDRLVFALRYLESMTLEDIAEALDVSLSTVKRNLTHASARVSRWDRRRRSRDLVTLLREAGGGTMTRSEMEREPRS